jgi:hypothetical protein
MNSKEDFIKREIVKTGFPLEDRVASVFHELENFEVGPSYNFADWQTGDIRELDMRVTYQVTPPPIRIEYVLLIECKSLPGNAWTFIKSSEEHILFKNSVSMWDNVRRMGRQEPVVKILEPVIKVNHITGDTFSRRYKEIIVDKERSNKRDDNILSSCIKLAKAVYFEREREKRSNMFLMGMKKDVDNIRLYYPIIIFDGEMYEATMLPDVSIRSISNAHLSHFSIQNGEEIDTVIDVMKSEKLKSSIQAGLLEEARQVRENEEKFRSSYLSLIHKMKLKKRIAQSLEMMKDFIPGRIIQ